MENRRESHDAVKPTKQIRYTQIMDILGDAQMTVDEVIDGMMEKRYLLYPDRNSVAPRMTELYQEGRLRIVGRKKSPRTKRSVSVYEAKKGGRRMMNGENKIPTAESNEKEESRNPKVEGEENESRAGIFARMANSPYDKEQGA